MSMKSQDSLKTGENAGYIKNKPKQTKIYQRKKSQPKGNEVVEDYQKMVQMLVEFSRRIRRRRELLSTEILGSTFFQIRLPEF